jgi:hypothetical protein
VGLFLVVWLGLSVVWLGLSVVSWLILINYYVIWVMVIHPLVVNSFNKICQD